MPAQTPPAAAPAAPYQVIARRYRPQTFSEVVGQQSVVQMLQNEIREGRIGHGYLFCGPRGTGKTSMARIFAKAINCLHGPTTEPCGVCSHCQEIAAGNHLDVIELDAATYTKVEQMRDLLEGLGRAPFSARRKVYIIDEVHMLSNSSFNALLKSLEEPPEHVVFVLATTNPEKIPETVVSRCRRCNFDRLGMKEITGCLNRILEREGARVEEEERASILGAIALASDGGLRDAQVLLDQLISLSDGALRLETVRSLLGVVEGDLFLRLLKSLVDRNAAECLILVGELVDHGRDLQRFVKMFLAFLRDAMILCAGGADTLARVVDPASADFRAILQKTTLPFLLNSVQQFLDLEEKMRGTAPPRFLLEFTLIKLTAIDPRLVIDPELGGDPSKGGGRKAENAGKTAAPSASASSGSQARTAPSPSASVGRARNIPVPTSPIPATAMLNERPLAAPPTIQEIRTTDADRWGAFVEGVTAQNASFGRVLSKARLIAASESKLDIELAEADAAMQQLFDRPEPMQLFRTAAQATWMRPLFPRFTVGTAPAPPPASAPDAHNGSYGSYAAHEPPAEYAEEPPPLSGPLTFNEALEKYPEFKQACALIERHFGVKPTTFNGRKLQAG